MSYGQEMRDRMDQSELERLRAEKAQMCQQLADATAALDKVASSVRDLPKLQMRVASEKLPAPRSSSGWVAAALSSEKQKRSGQKPHNVPFTVRIRPERAYSGGSGHQQAVCQSVSTCSPCHRRPPEASADFEADGLCRLEVDVGQAQIDAVGSRAEMLVASTLSQLCPR